MSDEINCCDEFLADIEAVNKMKQDKIKLDTKLENQIKKLVNLNGRQTTEEREDSPNKLQNLGRA